MSILYTYAVSESVLDRYLDNNQYRSHRGVDHLAITDCDIPGNHIDIGRKDGPFCLSRFRNAAIDCAIDGNYDLLVVGDADSVFLPQTLNQQTIYSTALVLHLEQGDTPFSVRHGTAMLSPCSWFVLHRSVFSKHRFSEDYKGYGYEDLEFNRRLKRAGINQGPCSLIAYHMWHPINVSPDEFSRNRKLYEST